VKYWNECCKETDTEWHWHLEPDGSLFVEFEGSTSRLDWKQNFNLFKRPYKDMPRTWYAHRGFVAKWHSVRDRFWQIISEAVPTYIYITGYSQGGALALLAHEDVVFNAPEIPVMGVSLGGPRVVGWRAPRDRWENFIRVRKGWDIVPLLPPWWMGYAHVGKREHVGRFWFWPLMSIKDHLDYPYHIGGTKDGQPKAN